jgi:hypothetical protein
MIVIAGREIKRACRSHTRLSVPFYTLGAQGPHRHPNINDSRGSGEHVSVQAPKR